MVLFWTATFLFDAVRSVLHKVYRIRRRRGLIMSFLRDLGFVVLAFVLFMVSNGAIWASSFVSAAAARLPELVSLDLRWLGRFIPTVVIVGLTTVMFFIVYARMTDVRPPQTAALISTVTTTALWVGSAKLFAVYLSDYAVIGKIYGPYTFLLVFLLWVYYSSLIFVLGAMVGQAYWERLGHGEAAALQE